MDRIYMSPEHWKRAIEHPEEYCIEENPELHILSIKPASEMGIDSKDMFITFRQPSGFIVDGFYTPAGVADTVSISISEHIIRRNGELPLAMVNTTLTPERLHAIADDWQTFEQTGQHNAARDLMFELNSDVCDLLRTMPEECTMLGMQIEDKPDNHDELYHRRKDDGI